MVVKAVSIFHVPPDGVEVTDGEVVSMRNSAGGDAHDGTAVVVDSAIQGVNITSSTTCFVDQNDPIVIKSSDGNTTLATSPAAVIGGAIDSIRLAGNYALFNSGGASIDVNQFDNSGAFAASYSIAANHATFTLANAVTRIAVNLGPVTIVDAKGKTAPATVAINQGAWANFPLSNGTDAIASNGETIAVNNSAGVDGVDGTAVVAAGALHVNLPASNAVVANGVGMQLPVTGTYVDTITATVSAGVITGFVLS